MRMTNKIMQTNSLYNINQTKILEDKYNTQLTSQSKITRPSDDPVVAIRALRLRSNVSTVSQYYDKNSPDASQWLDVTAQSLSTITDVITNLYSQVQTGVNKDYTASDMKVLLTQIESYSQEMYATGNQDYAGRYIFTGYRTDTALTMDKNELDSSYYITENIKSSQIDSFGYTDISVFDTVSSTETAEEQVIQHADLNRIRLSYNDLVKTNASGNPGIELSFSGEDTAVDALKTAGIADSDGNLALTIETYDSAEEAYKTMTGYENNGDTGKAIYIAETGEILFSSDVADKISDAMTDGAEISVSYTKENWLEDDLNPVHFFRCVDEDGIVYNNDGDVEPQITYDVGYNQVIQVNTNATEVFDPAFNRDYADLKYLVDQFETIETVRTERKEKLAEMEETDPDYEKVKNSYDAADKAYTYIRDQVSERFGDQITRYQTYLDNVDVAITKNGTRSTRLELISTRLGDQKSTFKELQENNEGIDMTEVAVQLTSAQTTYDAALAATSKILQNNLMNYI